MARDRTEQRGSVWQIRRSLNASYRVVLSVLESLEAEDDPRPRLAAIAEVRRHIALAQQVLRDGARADAVREFERAVLDVLAGADETLRQRVIEALHADGSASKVSGDD